MPDPIMKLKEELKAGRKKAADLEASVANLEAFAMAVEVVEKSKDGNVEELRKEFAQLDGEIAEKRGCHEHRLGEHLSAVEESLQQIDDAIACLQQRAQEAEETLLGQIERDARDAERARGRAEKRFNFLLASNLTTQVKEVRELVKAADAFSGTSLADSAAAYTFLSLASERLHYQWLLSDHISEKVEFRFPPDYVAALVDACLQVNKLAEEAAKKQQVWEETKAGFEADKKGLAAKRDSRKKDFLEAAKKAVQGYAAQKPAVQRQERQQTEERSASRSTPAQR